MSTMSYASIWNETLQKIQESNYFDTHTFNSWISKTTLYKIEDNIAYVAYRSTITFSILKKQKESDGFQKLRVKMLVRIPKAMAYIFRLRPH